MIQGITIILLFQFVGEMVSRFLNIPVPGTVLGFIFMFLALLVGIVNLKQIEEAVNLFLDNLTLIFIPAGVGLMKYLGIIKEQWLSITVSIFISSLLVFLITGRVAQFLERREKHGEYSK